jgi:hypothetical protein
MAEPPSAVMSHTAVADLDHVSWWPEATKPFLVGVCAGVVFWVWLKWMPPKEVSVLQSVCLSFCACQQGDKDPILYFLAAFGTISWFHLVMDLGGVVFHLHSHNE